MKRELIQVQCVAVAGLVNPIVEVCAFYFPIRPALYFYFERGVRGKVRRKPLGK